MRVSGGLGQGVEPPFPELRSLHVVMEKGEGVWNRPRMSPPKWAVPIGITRSALIGATGLGVSLNFVKQHSTKRLLEHGHTVQCLNLAARMHESVDVVADKQKVFFQRLSLLHFGLQLSLSWFFYCDVVVFHNSFRSFLLWFGHRLHPKGERRCVDRGSRPIR